LPFTPYEAGSHCLRRAEALLKASRQSEAAGTAKADMRRLSIVMAVAALDTYMHRLVVSRAFDHEELPKLLARLGVDFESLVSQAEESARAHREGRNSRPKVAVKRVLRDRLQRVTFQRHEDVSNALAMAGKSGHWDQIAASMGGNWTKAKIRTKLNTIVNRRNAIVHEGDYVRLERPQTPRRTELQTRDARRDIRFIGDLIDAIHETI
jgi:hypothetical protein